MIEQTYSEQDDRAHARWLARAFADPRYIRVHGRPMLVVYKPLRIAGSAADHRYLPRRECRGSGLPSRTWSASTPTAPGTDMRQLGFDMTEHHEPQLGVLAPDVFDDAPRPSKFKRNLKRGIPEPNSQDLFASLKRPS